MPSTSFLRRAWPAPAGPIEMGSRPQFQHKTAPPKACAAASAGWPGDGGGPMKILSVLRAARPAGGTEGRSRMPGGTVRSMKLILRFLGFLFAAGTILFVVGVAAASGLLWHYSKDLPDYSQLQDYEPPVMTRVHAADGSLVAEYARERRLYIPIQAVPKLVINAFLAAEDKNFYEHGGLDFYRHRARGVELRAELRLRPPPARRLNHHATSRQELLVIKRGFVFAQDQGSAAGAQNRAHLQQGQDPRALLERDLSRPRRLRHRLRLAHLFRQGRQRTHGAGSRLSGSAAEGAEQLSPVPGTRARARCGAIG